MPKGMTPKDHRAQHQKLHVSLDELVADWILHTQSLPSRATVLELMDWSARQTPPLGEPDHDA